MLIRRLTPLLLLVSVGCQPRAKIRAAVPSSMGTSTGDSIALISVVQKPDSKLERNTPTELLVTLKYTLSTRARAELVLDLNQFSTNQTCTDSEEAGIRSGQREIVATEVALIEPGNHTLQMRITWPGGKSPTGPPLASGAISLQASMRSEQPEYSFLTDRFGTQYCMQF